MGKSMLTLASTRTKDNFVFCSRDVSAGKHQSILCDLTDFNRVRQIIEEVRPLTIVNCAAYTAVDKAEQDRETAHLINAEAPRVIAEAAKKISALVVHYSTDYVFNGTGKKPWAENDQTAPINHYGQTKLAGELAIKNATDRYLILRTQWVYSDTGNNFLKTMLRLGSERIELKIVDDQVGAPTSADIIANATLNLIDRCHVQNNAFGIYNLACRGEVSWHGFAKEIFRRAESLGFPMKVQKVVPIPSTEYPTPAERPKNSRLDLHKIEQQLGVLMPTWQDALDSVLTKMRGGL